MRGFDRDLIRGKHYGQRSCEPHLKAEHMAAPTKSATRRFFLPTRSRPHMAQSGHAAHARECPLSGVKRTLIGGRRKATAVNRGGTVKILRARRSFSPQVTRRAPATAPAGL